MPHSKRKAAAFPAFVRTLDNPHGVRLKPGDRRMAFYHIQKTAGSTFRTMLNDLFEPEAICPALTPIDLMDYSEEQRDGFRLFMGHFLPETLDEHFSGMQWVTFLRDPVQRFLSEFYMDRNPGRLASEWVELAKRSNNQAPWLCRYTERVHGMELEEYLNWNNPAANARLVNRQTRWLAGPSELAFSSPDWDDDIYEAAKKNLRERFTFCGVVEHFDLSINLFCLTFGIMPYASTRAYIQNINPAKKIGNKYEVDPELRSYIEDRNRMDIALHNYAKKLLFERMSAFGEAVLEERGMDPKALDALRPEPEDESFELKADAMYGMRGLHLLEHDGLGRSFRWTGAASSVCIELLLPRTPDTAAFEVEIRAVAVISKNVADALTFTLDGMEPESVKCSKKINGMTVFKGTVPVCPERKAGSVRVLKVFAPVEPVPNDDRKLGVGLHAVRIHRKGK